MKSLDDIRLWLDSYAGEFAPYDIPGHKFCIEGMEIQHGGPLDKAVIFKLGSEILEE
jgi:hypothetical protein